MDCPSAIPVKLRGLSTLLERVPVGADKSANCSLHEESFAAWKKDVLPRSHTPPRCAGHLNRSRPPRHGTAWTPH
jgi:hypothetical protein